MKLKLKKDKKGNYIYPKLPSVFKSKWLKALRSDKFEQATSEFYNKHNESYCCLAVACAVQHPKLPLRDGGTICKSSFSIPISKVKVPKIIKGTCESNKLVDKLVDLNDNEGLNFRQIANWISKNL